MFRHYLKTAIRNLYLYKINSTVVISGLVVGFACCGVILLYVQDELNYDRFHRNGERIYRVVSKKHSENNTTNTASTPIPLASALLDEIPEIDQVVRFFYRDNPLPLVRYKHKRHYERGFYFSDASVLDVFSFPLIKGNPEVALSDPYSVIITEKTALKYFGSEDPIGKTLTFDDRFDLRVTGILRDKPHDSHLDFDFLVSFVTLKHWLGEEYLNSWHNECQTYILVSTPSYPGSLAGKLAKVRNSDLGENPRTFTEFFLQPLLRIHLYSKYDFGVNSKGDINHIYILLTISLLVLSIACINSTCLSMARSAMRAKELEIRKALGARTGQLFVQSIADSTLISIIALLITVFLVELFLPTINVAIGRKLEIDYRDMHHLAALIGFIGLSGICSGINSGIFLMTIQPVNLKRREIRIGYLSSTFSTTLVIVQFAISNVVIVCTIVVYNQLKFMGDKSLGFNGSGVVVVPIRDERLRQRTEFVKSALKENHNILGVTASALLPGGPVGQMTFRAGPNVDDRS